MTTKKSLAVPLLVLALLLVGSLVSCGPEKAGETIYWCSMHPEVRQSAPGTCPLCGGMRLVPLDAGVLEAESGVLALDPRALEQAGVRLASVERRDLYRDLELPARFTLDPQGERIVYNPLPGSSDVTALYVHNAGVRVEAGQVLVELENDLLAQQIAQLKDARKRYEALAAEEGRELQAKEMLKRRDTILAQIEDAGVEREWALSLANDGRKQYEEPRFPIQSPITGTLLRTPLLNEGRATRENEELFRLADTSQLWLELEAHESDLAWLQRGLALTYATPAVPEQTFRTTLDAIEPVFDTGRPEVRVRARATSAKGRILPGTWARAVVRVDAPDVLSLPVDAVLRSGRRDVAVIAEGGGRFRPVVVTLGRRDLLAAETPGASEGRAALLAGARWHEVLSGLDPGQRVVTAGNFLLLAEASFQGALEKLLAEPAGASGAETPAALAAALEPLLGSYEALRAALAGDRADGVAGPAQELAETARGLRAELGAGAAAELSGRLERLEEAAGAAALEAGPGPDLKAARVRFGAISREVVALVRAHAPERVASGALHLFRCPMARDFGFDLWLQAPAQMANPYMGLEMLECGVPAALE